VITATSDISVIIPYYNREQYIDQAIQSVLGQTVKPLEIILVNDCSRESSRRYLDRYKDICTIVDLPANVGLSGARNAGIQVARGRFIALLDDDDVWQPTKLQVQRRYMDEHPECSIVHCSYWAFFTDHPDEMKTLFPHGALTLADALTDEYWVCPSTMFFRADALHTLAGFDPLFRQCEDRDIVIRYCSAGYRIEGIRDPLIKLRRESQSSLTRNLWRIFCTDLRLCWKHKALYMRVYGLRGIVSYAMEKLYTASRETRYLDGGVRLLLRFIKVKYRVKHGYQDPIWSPTRIEPRGNPVLTLRRSN
jgi:glycosyltransferase involved in cell wall biosynthesis